MRPVFRSNFTPFKNATKQESGALCDAAPRRFLALRYFAMAADGA